MRRALELCRGLVQGLFLLSIAGGSSLASATDVRFVGSVGYSNLVNIVLLSADQIHNYATSGVSGALRMELWATPSPFTGSFAGGYQTVAYAVGPLAAGASLLNVSTGVLPFTSPPNGIWYVAMVLTEYTGAATNGGYSPVHYLRFAGMMTGTGGPPPPPPDTTPPSISITSPTGGNVAGTVTVSVNASDNVGVTRVDLLVNGQLAGSDTSAPYQYTWNSASVANGAVQLKAVAYDAAGNLAQSAIVAVNVANVVTPPPDTTPPMIALLSPGGGTVTGLVTLTATASDNVGVSRVDFYANGHLVGSDTSAPYATTWDSRNVADGAAILTAVAFDAAGNSGASAPMPVTVTNVEPPAASSYAIEYYHAALDHYFMSASPVEINALDSGQFAGWSRTGYAFKTYTQPTGTASPVCRFYLPPIVGDSHFYSASSAECAVVLVRFPMFVLESPNVFYVNLPDTVTGACPASMYPVYRVWNNRRDSNHRYMTDRSLRNQMVANGYIAEGSGPDIVVMCAPI